MSKENVFFSSDFNYSSMSDENLQTLLGLEINVHWNILLINIKA